MNTYPTPKIILCDIEGTTTSIDFVHEELFPYAFERMETFLADNWGSAEVKDALQEVAAASDCLASQLETPAAAAKLLRSWIKEDRKQSGLKQIQGLLWKAGYQQKHFCGHVYPDVKANFENWQTRGIKIGIYSSGSVAAQKLLFGHTNDGDLNPIIDCYFDTKVGAKKDEQSYINIAKSCDVDAGDILFLSDVEAELIAAEKAGMQITQVVRPKIQPSKTLPTVSGFDDITFSEEQNN